MHPIRLLPCILVLSIAHAAAAEPETKATAAKAEEKKSSVFDEFNAPDFSNLPAPQREEAQLRWHQDDPHGLKQYGRFLHRLKTEAKLPPGDSKYIGKWSHEGELRVNLTLKADGTFTWDYGHSSGTGTWVQHPEGLIWIGFDLVQKDSTGKERTFTAAHYCYLKGDDVLIQDHIDYTDTYKRRVEEAGRETGKDKEKAGSEPKPGPEQPKPSAPAPPGKLRIRKS